MAACPRVSSACPLSDALPNSFQAAAARLSKSGIQNSSHSLLLYGPVCFKEEALSGSGDLEEEAGEQLFNIKIASNGKKDAV